MQHWKRWLFFLGAGILIIGIFLILFAFVFTDFIVDFWWFQSLGYLRYFGLRLIYRYAIFTAVTLLFFLFFSLNFWAASRYLGMASLPGKGTSDRARRIKEVLKLFRTGSLKAYVPLSVFMGILIAVPLFEQWEATLFYIFGPKAHIRDVFYGKDISFYLFSLPIYLLILNRLFIACILLILGVALLYWLESRLLSKQDEKLPKGARTHLSILIFFLFFIGIWELLLQRYQLLYTTNHSPLFSGPGFVEIWVTLPLIWICLVLLTVMAFSVLFSIQRRKSLKIPLFFTVLFFLALGARYSSLLPDTVQKYIVEPNEISRERPYIKNNVQATLAAYDLDRVKTLEYKLEEAPWDVTDPEIKVSLRNIPVWDGEVLSDVYKQLQEIRTYYDFPTVDVDRYTVNGIYQQVFVAARELNLDLLPPGALNWINEHLKYTHGYGPVMTPAAQGGGEPMVWFIQDIPPRSPYNVTMKQPAIYYGLEAYRYVIAPNESGEFDYPIGDSYATSNYSGKGGVLINNIFRKLVFSIHYRDKEIFFTMKTNDTSRILFRRNIVERIKTITPFLMLDADPYIVVTPERLYWIQDAYTSSSWYPYSQLYDQKVSHELHQVEGQQQVEEQQQDEKQQFNYIRNSVKIVVDAYDGTVSYYIADSRDPIVRAYSRMYPGLFKDLKQMAPELRSHVRYPRDLFEIQMGIYAKYHQVDPDVFFKQEDVFQFPEIQRGSTPVKVTPYYLTLNLVHKDKFEFILLSPLNPMGRSNLRALAVVGCDGDDYGEITLYSFSKGSLVYGPSQVDALIDQNPVIAEQFTLWNQLGTQIERGKMIILPVGGAIVYIQPVYLKASGTLRIPELQRLIVSRGETVVMERSLEEGFLALNENIRAEAERLKRRRQELNIPKEVPGVAPDNGTVLPVPVPQSP